MSTPELTYYRGRVGLYAVLEALGVGSGDEVVTQAFTCVAVPEAILARGAQPVYADVEADGLNVDPGSIRERLTSATRAIVAASGSGGAGAISPANSTRSAPAKMRPTRARR